MVKNSEVEFYHNQYWHQQKHGKLESTLTILNKTNARYYNVVQYLSIDNQGI